MSADAEGSVTRFFNQVRQGDRSATRELWRRFFPRLLGLARKTLAGAPQRMADAEDAVQGAFVSFWRQAERGDFEGELHRDSLWRLLALMTVRKARKQLARERAEKRGGGRVIGEGDLRRTGQGDARLEEALGQLPAEHVDLLCNELLEMLDQDLRACAVLRLMGYKNREAAELLGCTERTIERHLNQIRNIWQREVAGWQRMPSRSGRDHGRNRA
jgi:RNA polymerase sigma factor (sigma-70 family)